MSSSAHINVYNSHEYIQNRHKMGLNVMNIYMRCDISNNYVYSNILLSKWLERTYGEKNWDYIVVNNDQLYKSGNA